MNSDTSRTARRTTIAFTPEQQSMLDRMVRETGKTMTRLIIEALGLPPSRPIGKKRKQPVADTQ